MKTIKRFSQIFIILLLTTGTISAVDDSLKVDLSVGADLVSHYIWRGLMLSNSPSIQPAMGLTYRGLSFGTWASYSINPSAFQEVDLYLSYSIGCFTIGVNDYYNPVDSIGVGDSYFNYASKSTLHTFEPFITLSEIGGTHFSTTAGVFVYGNDKDENGKNMYSSYMELSYATNIRDFGLNIFTGATFNKGYYAERPSIVNVGLTVSKEIKVAENFTIPCKGSFIVNPDTQNVYMVFGITF
jgi:hypothetical protein